MPEMMPPTVEKYALKICSLMNEISELEKLIRQRKGIVKYAAPNTDKVVYKTILKLKNAQIQLKKALDSLLVRIDKEDGHAE
jgi:hypothetical protein